MKHLCLIGNGLDLHHHLKTSYSNFRDYLMKHKKANFVMQLESFFQSEYLDKARKHQFLLWSDLEKAIGEFDVEELFHEMTDDIEIDYDHMMRTSAQYEDSPQTFLEPLLAELPSVMEDWIGSVDLKSVESDVSFPMQSTFLSFNYSRVLEDGSNIPDKNILHIHGIVGGSTELIVGHKGKM